jgi:uncharacterized protein YaaQ
VLFTLLVQGFSMDGLIKRLRIVERPTAQEEYERRHARYVAGRAAYENLMRLSTQGVISQHTWNLLSPLIERQNTALVSAVKEVLASDPTVEAEELDTARREALRAQRGALTSLLHDGLITEDVFSDLVGEVDAAMTEEYLPWPELLRAGRGTSHPVTRLMTAFIREADLENVLNALTQLGFAVDQFQSAGGFLKRRNVTLLVGLPAGREQSAVSALRRATRGEVEFGKPGEAGGVPLPAVAPVQVGGATIFTYDVDAYEEF